MWHEMATALRLSRRRLQKGSFQEEFGHSFGAGLDVELFVNAPDVITDSVNANAEFMGDLLVGQALRQSVDHGKLSL